MSDIELAVLGKSENDLNDNYSSNYFIRFGLSLFRLFVATALLIAVPLIASAFVGDLLDPGFGLNGVAKTQISGTGGSRAFDSAIQSDGKIVVVGTGQNAPSFPSSLQASVVRYNVNGTLDTTFDFDGIVITTLDAIKNTAAYAVTIQADGKIVIVGSVGSDVSGSPGFIVRYNTDGSLDTTFDGDGKKFYTIGSIDNPNDVLVQPDGKILVAEANWTSGFGGSRVLSRYNSNGLLDTTFGTAGIVRFTMFSAVASTETAEIALRPDGKIVWVFNDIENKLVQLNSDGTIDNSFGVNGVVNGTGGFSLLVQPDGKVVTTNRGTPNSTTVVTRYNANGSIDMGFGTNGKTVISYLNQDGSLARSSDVAIQTDGKLVVGGSIRLIMANFDYAITRLNANGTVDTNFAFNGHLTTNIAQQDYGYSVVIQPDGKIVLTGETSGGFTTARYVPGTLNLSCRPVSDFDNDGRSDLAYYTANGDWKYIFSSNGGGSTVNWGVASDILVPGDYDGDCRTDLGIFRNGVWYIRTTTGTQSYYSFGQAGDIAVPADYDGDDRTDAAVFRNGVWYVLGSQRGFFANSWGDSGDKPVSGDYDGDGKEDMAVYRNGVWWLSQTTDGVRVVRFGLATDIPVVGDYDGDARSDIAVYRPSDGTWYLLRSTAGFATLRWGISTDVPVPADYDGDGKTDVAIYRNGNWYLLQSSAGFQLKEFGDASVRPVQSAFIPQ